jgi:hypothetical protein
MKHGFEQYAVNFKSLRDNVYWQEIYKTYSDNIDDIAPLIKRVQKKYGMDFETARDSILYELTNSFINESNRKKLFNKNRLKWFLNYLLFMLAIAFSGFIDFILSPFKKRVKVDVIYEEMWKKNGLYRRFYKYIDKELQNSTVRTVLFNHPAPTKELFSVNIEGWNGEIINRRYSAFIFEAGEVNRVIYKDFLFFFKLWQISKNINITYLYIRFLRKIVLYKSQIHKIKANHIIMAADYYWNPIKYHQFKKNIKNIILIQHNMKTNIINNTFQYSDLHLLHSRDAIKNMEGFGNSKLLPVGSFQLIPFIEKVDLKYDIFFINQTVHDNLTNIYTLLDQKKLIEQFEILIENFSRYLSEHKHIKAVYVAKAKDREKTPFTEVKYRLSNLTNIDFYATYGSDTFQLLQQSKLVINMYSSVGREAYGLDKRVLWVNYKHSCSTFGQNIEKEELHTLIDDNSYEIFKDRVDLLLSDNEEVKQHFKNLKEEYMNIRENPAKLLAKQIKT